MNFLAKIFLRKIILNKLLKNGLSGSGRPRVSVRQIHSDEGALSAGGIHPEKEGNSGGKAGSAAISVTDPAKKSLLKRIYRSGINRLLGQGMVFAQKAASGKKRAYGRKNFPGKNGFFGKNGFLGKNVLGGALSLCNKDWFFNGALALLEMVLKRAAEGS